MVWRTPAWWGAGALAQPDASHVPQHQIVQYLTDMFDLDNVRYTSVPALAEDILQLSRRRSEILLGYLGVPAARRTGPQRHCSSGCYGPRMVAAWAAFTWGTPERGLWVGVGGPGVWPSAVA